MRISLKTLAIFWVLLLAIIGGLLYNAYSKFKADAFIAVLTEQVQKNYPGAKLNVGKIAYRFSLDFNLKLQDVHLRRSDKLLGSIKEIELKVPWWLLLVNKGNARINLSDLDVYVDQDEVPKISEVTPEDTATASEVVKISVPSYFAETRFTLRAKNISLRDINSSRRYFTISKLLVREFQYGKNTAFEVNVPIEINLKKAKYRSELWLFGDVTPEVNEWKLNFRGEFRTREINDKSQLEDLVINGNMSFIPNALSMNSAIELLHDRDSIGKGNVVANQDSITVDVNFVKLPLSYFNSLYETSKNPYLVNPVGNAAGNVIFKRRFDTSKADVTAKLEFPAPINLNSESEVLGKWSVDIQNRHWEVAFNSNKGDVSFLRKSDIDLSKNQVQSFSEKLSFTGVELEKSITSVQGLETFLKENSTSQFASEVSFKKCYVGEEVYDGLFIYGVADKEKFYKSELKSEKGSFKMDFQQARDLKHSLELKAISFSWLSSFGFAEPYFHANSGVISGQMQGQWTDQWESGIWKVKLTGENLVQKEGKFTEFFEKTFSYFERDVKNTKKDILELTVKNSVINVIGFSENMEGETAKVSGTLSSKQKSSLEFQIPKNKKFRPIVKEVIEPYWMQKEEI